MSSMLSGKKKHLEFRLGEKLFAYPIEPVREIIEFPVLESVDSCPQSVMGVMNLRGSLVIVFDLSIALGQQPNAIGNKTCVVVTDIKQGGQSYTVGIKVDLVSQVIDIEYEQVESVPELDGRLTAPMIRGLAKLPDRLLTILDIDSVLSDEQWKWITKGKLDAIDTDKEPEPHV